jgi:hypothetical protein
MPGMMWKIDQIGSVWNKIARPLQYVFCGETRTQNASTLAKNEVCHFMMSYVLPSLLVVSKETTGHKIQGCMDYQYSVWSVFAKYGQVARQNVFIPEDEHGSYRWDLLANRLFHGCVRKISTKQAPKHFVINFGGLIGAGKSTVLKNQFNEKWRMIHDVDSQAPVFNLLDGLYKGILTDEEIQSLENAFWNCHVDWKETVCKEMVPSDDDGRFYFVEDRSLLDVIIFQLTHLSRKKSSPDEMMKHFCQWLDELRENHEDQYFAWYVNLQYIQNADLNINGINSQIVKRGRVFEVKDGAAMPEVKDANQHLQWWYNALRCPTLELAEGGLLMKYSMLFCGTLLEWMNLGLNIFKLYQGYIAYDFNEERHVIRPDLDSELVYVPASGQMYKEESNKKIKKYEQRRRGKRAFVVDEDNETYMSWKRSMVNLEETSRLRRWLMGQGEKPLKLWEEKLEEEREEGQYVVRYIGRIPIPYKELCDLCVEKKADWKFCRRCKRMQGYCLSSCLDEEPDFEMLCSLCVKPVHASYLPVKSEEIQELKGLMPRLHIRNLGQSEFERCDICRVNTALSEKFCTKCGDGVDVFRLLCSHDEGFWICYQCANILNE